MKSVFAFASLAVAALLANAAGAAELQSTVSAELPSLLSTYQSLHAHPELSHHEEKTAALLAAELRRAGFKVTERVGRYADGSQAYGVVALLANGAGPKLLIRGDKDALPVVENTGAPYASTVRSKTPSGQDVGVMHACGHDVHTTVLLGTARALAATRSQWHGSLMLIGQPSEETVDGARAMLADGLYERFGTPDMAIALHDTNARAAGTVSITSGAALASSTSIDVLIRGIGGHGARPQEGKDPIVMAAQFINQIQTIVSRQQNPQDPAVVTVGDIHGGTKRNIIPYEVKLELTARAFSDRAQQVTVDGVRNAARGIAIAAGLPEDLYPVVTIPEQQFTPVTYNDPALSARLKSTLRAALGADRVFDEDPIMASEDFGAFGLDQRRIPSVMFWLGAVDEAALNEAKSRGTLPPGMHTDKFLPVPEPTLRTGVTAMTAVALDLLKP